MLGSKPTLVTRIVRAVPGRWGRVSRLKFICLIFRLNRREKYDRFTVVKFISIGIFSERIPSVTSFPSSDMNSAILSMKYSRKLKILIIHTAVVKRVQRNLRKAWCVFRIVALLGKILLVPVAVVVLSPFNSRRTAGTKTKLDFFFARQTRKASFHFFHQKS